MVTRRWLIHLWFLPLQTWDKIRRFKCQLFGRPFFWAFFLFAPYLLLFMIALWSLLITRTTIRGEKFTEPQWRCLHRDEELSISTWQRRRQDVNSVSQTSLKPIFISSHLYSLTDSFQVSVSDIQSSIHSNSQSVMSSSQKIQSSSHLVLSPLHSQIERTRKNRGSSEDDRHHYAWIMANAAIMASINRRNDLKPGYKHDDRKQGWVPL